MHILQMCDGSKGLRYQRHHAVCNTVAEKLKNRGFLVYQEKTYRSEQNLMKHRRPDIVAVRDRTIYVLDPTIVYERAGASFSAAYNARTTLYKHLEKDILENHQGDVVIYHGLTVGARGSMFHSHIPIWKSLQFSEAEITSISIDTLYHSIRISNSFRKCCKQ
jgi:hypothetical protein